jgi:hypothetical protein
MKSHNDFEPPADFVHETEPLPEWMRAKGFRLRTEPLPKGESVPEPEYNDHFFTADGREFRLSYEPLTIVEVGSTDEPLRFSSIAQADQVWVDLQALFGVKSELASDPDWDEFPEPTAPTIQ